jgi:hypothetical protein
MSITKEIHQRTIVELLVTPATIGTMILGTSLLVIGWAASSVFTGFIGFCALTVTCGIASTNFLFGYETAQEKAVEFVKNKNKKVKEDTLDELDAKLVQARGKNPDKDQNSLRKMRKTYECFLKEIESGLISKEYLSDEIILMFEECVNQLQYSCVLWNSACQEAGDTKRDILMKRDNLVDEISKNVDHFVKTINSIRDLSLESKKGNKLNTLQQQLNMNLEIARRTHEEMQGLTNNELATRN